MDEKQESSPVKPVYTLISVEKAEPLPDWLPAGNWFRYTIRQGDSDLKGYRAGTLNAVTQYAEAVADDLNNRNTNGKYSAAYSRGKPAKPAKTAEPAEPKK
jgi:hypothetical protein